MFDTLPDEEKTLWHPHDYEVLSGQLVAPGLPDAAERALVEQLMNSYGKPGTLTHRPSRRPAWRSCASGRAKAHVVVQP